MPLPYSLASPLADFVPVGTGIRDALVADSAFSALAGTRVYPQVMPEGGTLPAVVYSVVSAVPENSLDGTAGYRRVIYRVQLDCYSTTYLGAHQVADAANAVVANLSTNYLSGWLDSMQDLYDNETQLFRVSADFIVIA